MAERGWLPAAVIRLGNRMLDQKRLLMESKGDAEAQRTALSQVHCRYAAKPHRRLNRKTKRTTL
jgi:hypothetical protein